MTAASGAPVPPSTAPRADGTPQPRRTRAGAVIVGPTRRARYGPGALIGLPLLAVLLSSFPAAMIERWREGRIAAGADGIAVRLLEPAPVQLLAGALLLWAVVAAWAAIPLLLVHRVVHLDPRTGELSLRTGLRGAQRRALVDVVHAGADPERTGTGTIGFADGADWTIPAAGWDGASFDGMRALQEAAGLPVQPPRASLIAVARAASRLRAQREMAARIAMPWRTEYDADPAAFLAEFDRRRRVLGRKEPARPGDLLPGEPLPEGPMPGTTGPGAEARR